MDDYVPGWGATKSSLEVEEDLLRRKKRDGFWSTYSSVTHHRARDILLLPLGGFHGSHEEIHQSLCAHALGGSASFQGGRRAQEQGKN